MRRILVLAALLLALARPSDAQTVTSRVSTTTCPGTGCIAVSVIGVAGLGVQVTGTYSGTLSFEGSVDGLTFVALLATPPGTTTAVTSTTSTGVWQSNVGGLTIVRVRMSSYSSGIATVSLQLAPSAR